MKTCTRCKKQKDMSEYYKINTKAGYTSRCKKCHSELHREWRNENKETHLSGIYKWRKCNPDKNKKACKKYSRTKEGFLLHRYLGANKRIEDPNNKWYYGLEIMNQKSFIELSLQDPKFNILFQQWELSNYERRLSPSPDRLDSSKGYIWDNIEWVTFSENAKRGAIKRWSSR